MTAGEIERYIYGRISAMPLPIGGGVYYRGTRPMQNTSAGATEDLIIAVTTGNHELVQRGTAIINVYVPDVLTSSGMFMRDKGRTDSVEAWLATLPALLSSPSIQFYTNSLIVTLPEESIHQHFVSLKMDFITINTNQ